MLFEKAFTLAYIECAEWAENCEMTDEEVQDAALDCADFCESFGPLMWDNGLDAERCGHDFWLTRNRHGAGFWDRGLGELGRQLTDAAHPYGEAYLENSETWDLA